MPSKKTKSSQVKSSFLFFISFIKYLFILFFLLLGASLIFLFLYKNNGQETVVGSNIDVVESYIPFNSEAYHQYERIANISLPRNKKGLIDLSDGFAHNNQIDAFRHSFVSGAFAQKYGVFSARILGDAKEFYDDIFYNQSLQEKNMDKWNNSVGRRVGLKTKNLNQLGDRLKSAIDNHELILNIKDKRRYY